MNFNISRFVSNEMSFENVSSCGKTMSANQKKNAITSIISLSSFAVDLCWGF